MQKSIDINSLSVGFQTQHKIIPVLEDVNFSIKPGETLVLLGESGCGKSMTSLALMRLLPRSGVYSSSSQINVDGEDILNLPENMMRLLRGRKLAIIFQEPMTALNPVMTVGDQIAEVLRRNHDHAHGSLKQAIITLLKEVEIPQPEIKIHQYPHQLSGGQKQRVVIAMALACKPEILIADEPTTALDVTIQAQILALLKKLQKTHQMSLLLITHDLGVVRAMADRVCVMYAGQVVEQGDVNAFFSEVRHPYVQQLLSSVPSFAKRDEKLSVIQGSVPTIDALPSGCRFHPRCLYAFERCQLEEPLLQVIGDRTVRCHLYPERQSLQNFEPATPHPPSGHLLPMPGEKENRKEVLLEKVLLVNNLSVHFIQGKGWLKQNKQVFKAVDQLSFSLLRGKTLALVGESGCGKTSAARAILRLIPTHTGEIYFRQQNVLTMTGRALRNYRKKAQIIFQDPFSSMNPRLTIGEIIAEGMHAQGMRRSEIVKRQKQLLDQVNLPATSLDRYPHQFSGGQRQRICIARALATQPDILICDEPTSALDISVQAQILNLLKELQQEMGISYLFITHNMAVVSYIADDVMVMKDGKVLEMGTCEQVLKNPEKEYTKQLLSAVLEL